MNIIGTRAPKIDGPAKATGGAKYADDLRCAGMLFGVLVRSPHAHARIGAIDVADALAVDGVAAVMTGADLPALYGIIPWTQDETALAQGKVLYVGQPVAAIAARDEVTARAASKLVRVNYEVLEPIFSPEVALARADYVLNAHAKHGNISKNVDLSFGDVDGAFASAAVVVANTYVYGGSTHAALEPHCALANFEATVEGSQLTVWSSTQVPHYLHRALSQVLGLPPNRVRVIQPSLGGGFGGKSEPFAFELCAAKLAMLTGRPVKILLTREEVFYTHRGRHPMRIDLGLAANAEGELMGARARTLIDGGAYSSFGLVTTYYSGQLLCGPYRLGALGFHATRVFTNKPPCGPKRGHGVVQPRFAFEVALDELAEKLHIDPLDLRQRNALGENVTTINGQRITSNGFVKCLAAVAKASHWYERRRHLGFGRGLGVAGSMYICGTNYPIYPNEMPQSAVLISLNRSGKVTLFTGASDIGQGSDSLVAAIACEELGCELADVRVVAADTDLCPVDLGAYSSRVTFMVGNACIDACQQLRRKVRTAVARAWKIPLRRVVLKQGRAFDMTDASHTMPLREAFVAAETRYGALAATGSYKTPKLGGDYRGGSIGASPAYSFTAHVAEVAVDVETGIINVERIWVAHDCGRALNPTLVEGQLEGSAYMGFAEALFEEQSYHESGAVAGLHISPSLLDYKLPSIADTPKLTSLLVESIDPEGPYGAKECGEGPLHPSIPAIANAVYHAVGIRLRQVPFHPAQVLQLLDEQQAQVIKHGASC